MDVIFVTCLNQKRLWSETTLNYRMMVERYTNLKEEVGCSIPSSEISFLRYRILAGWSTATGTLLLVCRPSISKNKKTNNHAVVISHKLES